MTIPTPTPDPIQKATTVIQNIATDPTLVADAQTAISKLPPKARAAIYDTGVALGVAASVGLAVIAVLTGKYAELGGEIITLFSTVQALIAKAHIQP
ncbi:hypothetical protein [Gryllotalpicola sp.]|uniref:hypothetical protein n=1 Tax=Gryllotalpicola sp. TaxID=1932787 RepID=UPI002611772D|nr:hypothetical protein [Gryllotalpicola sp.]